MSWSLWFLLSTLPAVLAIVVAHRTKRAAAHWKEFQETEKGGSNLARVAFFFGPLLAGALYGFHAAIVIPGVVSMAGTPGIRLACFMIPHCSVEDLRDRESRVWVRANPDEAREIRAGREIEGVLAFLKSSQEHDPRYGDRAVLRSLQWISAALYAYAAWIWFLPMFLLTVGLGVFAAMVAAGGFVLFTIVRVVFGLFSPP